MKFDYPEGATPLEHDEIKNLIPLHITTQDQLNEWEQKNILCAEKWAYKNITLTISFIKILHKKMFDQTWKWAGMFRKTEKNIGINSIYISLELQKLCDDVQYQIENKSFDFDEIAVRFHHRLVFIHPFENGNGRHARLMADLLILFLGKKRFSWGLHQNLSKKTSTRTIYIQALKKADQGDYKDLIIFSRS